MIIKPKTVTNTTTASYFVSYCVHVSSVVKSNISESAILLINEIQKQIILISPCEKVVIHVNKIKELCSKDIFLVTRDDTTYNRLKIRVTQVEGEISH